MKVTCIGYTRIISKETNREYLKLHCLKNKSSSNTEGMEVVEPSPFVLVDSFDINIPTEFSAAHSLGQALELDLSYDNHMRLEDIEVIHTGIHKHQKE